MLALSISFFAGIVTVLAPCVLPILPIVLGATLDGPYGLTLRALPVIASLLISIIIFTYLFKVSSLFVGFSSATLALISGTLIIAVGLTLVFPQLWSSSRMAGWLGRRAGAVASDATARGGLTGPVLLGGALGLVFSSCSPAYLFIVATIIPVDLVAGTTFLLAYIAGLAFSLILIALIGMPLVRVLSSRMGAVENSKRVFGAMIMVFGILIATGYEKKAETWILQQAPAFTIKLEDGLVERYVRPIYE